MIVPLDYSNPGGEKITIGMKRLKSTSRTPSLGTLLVNPGGPGGAASLLPQFVADGAPIFSDALMAAYDIIGVDPRGVGLSTPVKCDPAVWNQRFSIFPKTQSEYDALVAYNRAAGQSCARLTGNLINHLSSAEVVEDFELFRQAINAGKTLSQSKLNFLAFSYGTQLAVQYAEQYAQNVGRFVLDGIVDHSLPETAALIGEASTLEATLHRFFSWCESASASDCPIQGQDLPTFFANLVEGADSTPITASGCTPTTCYSGVTGDDIRAGVQGMLMGPDISGAWPALASALAQAAGGDAAPFAAGVPTSQISGQYLGLAIGCQDWLHDSASFADVLSKGRMVTALAPLTRGVSLSYSLQVSCLGWPAPVTNAQHPLKPKALTAPAMLLVTALNDPATSISWATGVADQLPKSVLLTRNGAGHTSFPLNGDAQRLIDNFLLTGQLPARGTMVNS
ncbi:hypothetical protein ABW20_dc0100356 [Dactylellina cionopaga]|nr:hypothetical protein ABW20_dc0100356 [Dactylellina cionopaga]